MNDDRIDVKENEGTLYVSISYDGKIVVSVNDKEIQLEQAVSKKSCAKHNFSRKSLQLVPPHKVQAIKDFSGKGKQQKS